MSEETPDDVVIRIARESCAGGKDANRPDLLYVKLRAVLAAYDRLAARPSGEDGELLDWLEGRLSPARARAVAAFTASNTTAPGSEPATCRMTSTWMRAPQRSSCSIAAARNVSAAPSTTL